MPEPAMPFPRDPEPSGLRMDPGFPEPPGDHVPAESPRPRTALERDEVDAPASVLQRLRAAALARGEGRVTGHAAKKIIKDFGEVVSAAPGTARKRRWRDEAWDPRTLGGYTGPGKSSRDPQGVGAVMSRMIAARGWREPVAVSSVLSRWADLVGPSIAAHSTPESFENAEVTVRCDSTNYAAILRTMVPTVLHTLEQELGPGVVTRITVHGPTVPTWKKGRRVAPGGRGPRDTYG